MFAYPFETNKDVGSILKRLSSFQVSLDSYDEELVEIKKNTRFYIVWQSSTAQDS